MNRTGEKLRNSIKEFIGKWVNSKYLINDMSKYELKNMLDDLAEFSKEAGPMNKIKPEQIDVIEDYITRAKRYLPERPKEKEKFLGIF